MISVSPSILDRAVRSYGKFFQELSGIDPVKCARDVLDEEKVHDQVELFCKTISKSKGFLNGKTLLEVGSGFGIFVAVTRRDYGIESYGIEPASEGFDTSYSICRDVLISYNLDPDIVRAAQGEDLPFDSNSIDLVFSSSVLEHVRDPERVLQEAVRVLKPGGYLQFVIPNYAAVFDGHYGILWVPYMGRKLGRLWVRLQGRDPRFVDTLQFTNYFKVRRWVGKLPCVDVITFGESIFRERMLNIQIKEWACLGRVKRWLTTADKLKLVPFITWLFLAVKSFDPIVLTLRKRDL
jgi:ubiquinone/menaquinone biosynthesis C-methylase UbiE